VSPTIELQCLHFPGESTHEYWAGVRKNNFTVKKKDKSQESKVKYFQVLAGTSPHVPLVANNRNK